MSMFFYTLPFSNVLIWQVRCEIVVYISRTHFMYTCYPHSFISFTYEIQLGFHKGIMGMCSLSLTSIYSRGFPLILELELCIYPLVGFH
jgi:hypothetical protein